MSMLQPDHFAPLVSHNPDAGYNAHRTIGDFTISVSYGGRCYGSGFHVKPNGHATGTFEVCVWNNKTDEVVLAPDGNSVRGWLTLEQVNDILSHYHDLERTIVS